MGATTDSCLRAYGRNCRSGQLNFTPPRDFMSGSMIAGHALPIMQHRAVTHAALQLRAACMQSSTQRLHAAREGRTAA